MVETNRFLGAFRSEETPGWWDTRAGLSQVTQPMSDYDTTEVEGTDVKPRLRRGVTECMTVMHKGGDVYSVTSHSGHEYTVDAREGRCTCPDYKHNLTDDERCKHALRVAVVRGDRVIPAAIERETVDPLLGQAVETTPVAVATDGGRVRATEADVDSVSDDEGQYSKRPDDCGCWNPDGNLPCWPCYRDGFEEPNPHAKEENE